MVSAGLAGRQAGQAIAEAPSSPPPALTLQQALAFAADRYRPLRIAKEQVMLTQMRLVDAQRNFLPQVTLRWTESEGRISTTEFKGRDYKAEFEQPVFHSGELYQLYRQAKANFQLARHRYARARLEVTLDVGRAYYQVARALAQAAEHHRLVGQLVRDRDLAKAAFQRDAIPAVEWMNAESLYQQALLQETSSEQEVELARLELQRAMGWEEQAMTLGQPPAPLALRYVPIALDQAIQLAFEHRPELLMQQTAREAAQAGERAARARGWPRIDVRAQVGKGSEVARDLDLDPKSQWFVGLQGSVPLGPNTVEYSRTEREDFPRISSTQSTRLSQDEFKVNIWNNRWQIDRQEATVAREQAEYELTEGIAQLRREVTEAYYLYRRSLLDIEATLSRIDFQEREVAIQQLRAQHQEASISDVMQGRVQLMQERSAHHRAIADYYVALLTLNKAIGIDNHYPVLN